MNVIFLDFDGVLDTYHYSKKEDIERRVMILSDMCHTYNCKVVIEAAAKSTINPITMKSNRNWVNYILLLFKKYHIDCIGITPKINDDTDYVMWKEDEILLYLSEHPEIEHYCIIDDDDLGPNNSDLNKVRDHLVKTLIYSDNPEEEGLLEKHKEEVGNVLKLDINEKKIIKK